MHNHGLIFLLVLINHQEKRMKGISKSPKVNSLSLAKVAAQLNSKLEFDLQPFLQDKIINETLEKITISINKLEIVKEISEKWKASEIADEFQTTDKNLEKVKDKVNHLQEVLTKIEKTLQDKIIKKSDVLKKTDPKDNADSTNREKVENLMKSIKQMLEAAKKKLKDLQDPTEIALKKLHAIKPKLYALGISDNFERCQKKAEKLSEELGDLCKASTEMIMNTDAAQIVTSAIKSTPIKFILPKLKNELEKSRKLLDQAGVHLNRLMPESAISNEVSKQNESSNQNSVNTNTIQSNQESSIGSQQKVKEEVKEQKTQDEPKVIRVAA